jgi:pyruvate dehydrogenase E1 component alpha subunit
VGDGALGEGAVYESFNFAALWGAPVLFVVENNHIAQTTPTQLAMAGAIAARFAAFGIPSVELDTSDVLEIAPAAASLLGEVRQTQTPRGLILNTCRFGPHSKSDDTRPAEEIERLRRERDPLTIHAARLDPATRQSIEVDTAHEIQLAFNAAMEMQ